MKISAEYLDPGANNAPEEAATVARITILIGGENVTDMRIAGERSIQDHVVAPTYPIAEALAFRWWQTLYGRGRVIKLRTLRSGFVLPDVTLFGTGNGQLEIECRPYAYSSPKIQFVSGSEESIAIDDLADIFERFFMEVLDQLGEQRVGDTLLSQQFERIEASIDDPDELEFCRAAGSFGVDPYACDERVSNLIVSAGKLFRGDGLEEFLSGLQPQDGEDTLQWITKSEKRLAGYCDLPMIENIRGALGYRRAVAAPWTEGYASARKVRRMLKVDEDKPIPTKEAVAELFGNTKFAYADYAPSSIRGISHVTPGHASVFAPKSRHADSELFGLMRTIGDAIHFGGENYSPVTNLQGTYRQQMGRSFAAEFLAPVETILAMRKRDTLPNIAEHFGVAEHVIHHQLENQYRIQSAN